MITHEAIEKLLATGRAQNGVIIPEDGDPFFINASGEVTGLEEYYLPKRINQVVKLLDAESFSEYVNRFKGPDSLIFANLGSGVATFKAVLDYHQAPGAKPDWCDHVAIFETQETPEWKVWREANRNNMNQVQFANFIEDNLKLFVKAKDEHPAGVELLELVKSLHGHKNASFDTALRLDNGAYSVNYTEQVDVRGNSAKGSIELPKEICGGFALYHGTTPCAMPARLKTRIKEGKLEIWFETIALPHAVREALLLVVKEVESRTQLKPLLGDLQ